MNVISIKDLEWLTVTQTSQFTGISPSKIRRAITEEKLTAFRDGKTIRICRKDLDDYMRRGCAGEL